MKERPARSRIGLVPGGTHPTKHRASDTAIPQGPRKPDGGTSLSAAIKTAERRLRSRIHDGHVAIQKLSFYH